MAELALLRTAVKSSYKKILFIVYINARSPIVHSIKVNHVVQALIYFGMHYTSEYYFKENSRL
jgi:hypothetical protein